MNFIEVAIDNVNDFIIHSFLDIEIDRKVFKTTRKRVQKLWIYKIIMIINEINMINIKLLTKLIIIALLLKLKNVI
jgi:hypothetical protein